MAKKLMQRREKNAKLQKQSWQSRGISWHLDHLKQKRIARRMRLRASRTESSRLSRLTLSFHDSWDITFFNRRKFKRFEMVRDEVVRWWCDVICWFFCMTMSDICSIWYDLYGITGITIVPTSSISLAACHGSFERRRPWSLTSTRLASRFAPLGRLLCDQGEGLEVAWKCCRSQG